LLPLKVKSRRLKERAIRRQRPGRPAVRRVLEREGVAIA
jgi:hypothetical protein